MEAQGSDDYGDFEQKQTQNKPTVPDKRKAGK